MTTHGEEHRHMARALQLARRGLYTADPNPRVGCVLVRDGRVVGEGWHARAGEPHAEIHALRAAGADARGACAYVTLEPCCHYGRTPPCTRALLEARVAQVVAAMHDPSPGVSGRGLRELAAAGIDTRVGVLAGAAEALNPGFVSRLRRGRPYVRVKLAASLDGRTAMASGESQWITGREARRDGQRLRARSSAIVTGIGTVHADDPALTVRLDAAESEHRQPLRVVVDPRLEMSPEARMLARPGSTVVVAAVPEPGRLRRLERAGAEVVALPDRRGRVDLTALMRWLATREANEVLVESGAGLAGGLAQAALVDEVVLYMAPTLLGDRARALVRLPGLERLADAVALEIEDVRAVGADWRIIARPRAGAVPAQGAP